MFLWVHTPSDLSNGKTGFMEVKPVDAKKMIDGGTAQLASAGAHKLLPVTGKMKTLKQPRKKKAKAKEEVVDHSDDEPFVVKGETKEVLW
jgi:hypothetical protein